MIRRLYTQIGWGKFLLLLAFSVAFGASERTGGASALSTHVLAALNDQYYFIFAVLPILLFICGSVMEDDAEIVIFRYGTYRRYFTAKWSGLGLLCSGLWLAQMVTLFLTGLGLQVTANKWDDLSGGNLSKETASLLAEHFPGPWAALLCTAIFLLIGYWLVSLLALWLGHFLSRPDATKALLALYALSVLSIKLPVISRPPFCYWTGLNYWVLLLHNLAENWRFPLTVIVTILFVAAVAYTIRSGWRHSPFARRAPRGLAAYYRRLLFSNSNMLLLFGSIFLLAGWIWYSGGAPQTGREWVFRLLAGHGTGYFYPLGFMALLFAELFPLWPLGRMLSQAASEHSVCLAVRLKRRSDLLWPLLRASGEWIACWCGLLVLAEAVPALMLGFELPVGLILEATGLRFLDMALQALVICLLLCLSGQAVFGFLSVILLHTLSLLPILWFPVGLSSLLRLHFMETGGVMHPTWAALELGICNLILLFWLYRYGAKRLFEKSGG